MKRYIWVRLAGALLFFSATAGGSFAQTCGGKYSVQSGDSLSVIADGMYKDAKKWTAIHQNNLDQIGPSPDSLRVGMVLDLICINGFPVGLEGGTDVSAEAAAIVSPVITEGTGERVERIDLVTGDDYAPFTDRTLNKGGMLTELVQRAMEEANPAEGFAIHWVNDWDSHLGTLLEQGLVDMSFPWSRPNCEETPDEYRCQTFLFSDPMFEILELVYIDNTRPFAYESDADMVGKTLCRMSGYSTHELDQGGRNWVKEGKIKLERPDGVDDCFNLLLEGKVDAVMIDEFAGKAVLKEMGQLERIQPLPRPLGIVPLNVLIHKGNPRAAEIVETINVGLRKLKATGEYQEIVGRHLTAFWAEG
jgi:polar amino acid transport system substrate-binding protein